MVETHRWQKETEVMTKACARLARTSHAVPAEPTGLGDPSKANTGGCCISAIKGKGHVYVDVPRVDEGGEIGCPSPYWAVTCPPLGKDRRMLIFCVYMTALWMAM